VTQSLPSLSTHVLTTAFSGIAYGVPSENIVVRNNRFGFGHGMTIGSEMSGGVRFPWHRLIYLIFSCRNVLFINNTMKGGIGGCRLKSDVLRGGYVTNVRWNVYRLLTFLSVAGDLAG
jgi:polygalacturonase